MRRTLLLALVLALAVTAAPAGAQEAEPKVLVFSKTAGFRHGSIPAGVAAIRSLGQEHCFDVDATEDAADFSEANLSQYDAVIWLSTTGDVLNDSQQDAFEAYVAAGGGYAGVHAAADTEYDWAWYGGLVGAYFKSHPAIQQATVDVEDHAHPSTAHLPDEWVRTDEWYDYRANPRDEVNVLASLDESTYSGHAMDGDDHPIAWYHEYGGGRSWYTGGGHTNESFSEPAYLQHLLGGIQYAAGIDPEAECEPPPPDECEATASDEFDGDALDTTVWSEIVRENPGAYEVSDGALRITTEVGDLWLGGGNVKNIISRPAPDGDFSVTTEVTIDADAGGKQAGLMLYAGDDDYIKLNQIGRDGNRWFEFILEQGGSPRFEGDQDRSPNLPAGFPETFQARISRQAGAITGAYSTDEGATWTSVGRPAAADALADPRIAVFAQTNDGSQVTEAAFDWVRVSGAGSGDPDDEFDGDALDCGRWTRIVRENPDRYGVSDGSLRITTANGDLYGTDRDNVENIVLQRAPGGAWEATTELTIDASGGGEQGGLILYAGDDDYAKLGHIAKNGEKWFELVIESGGSPRVAGSTEGVPVGGSATFQLRLTHANGMLTAAVSPDGETWTAIGEPEDVGGFADPYVGLFAQTNDDGEVTEAAFDWFHLTAEDSGAPTVRADVDGLLTSGGAYLGSADVTLTASDGATIEYAIDDGDWQPYTEPVHVTGAGEHEVRYRATDEAGNESEVGTRTVTVADGGDCDPVTPEEGYTAIYDGTLESLADWSMAGPGGFDPGDEPCTIDAWGGMGLLWYSAHELNGPYTIRAEWRIYSDDDNSGVFIGFPDPQGDPWNPVSQGYEIQIDPTDEPVRTTGAVYSFQAPDEEARAEALNPYGEWNVMEVEVDGDDITIRLNGTVINEYTSPHPERSPDVGFVGIQNDGAGRDVTYRSVQVKGGGLEPGDTTAPATTAALDPADPGAGGTYHGPVGVTLSAAGGAAFTEYRIDGGEWTRAENTAGDEPFGTTFTVSAEGDHVVEFRSTDSAGNEEEAGSIAFSIDGGGPTDPDAPTVQAFADPASGEAPLEVQFSASGLDPQGGELTYRWEFSDGGSSLQQSPARTYTEPGTYTATVTATDPEGKSAVETVEVVVSERPNAAPSVRGVADRTTGTAPLPVEFSAQATDADGPASEITYLWDFADGGANAFGRNARHTYTEPGTYTATVTATDGEGAFDTAEVTVVVDGPPANRPPSVQVAASPRSGTAPLPVHFSSATRDPDGQAVSTVWDFGDGVKAGGPSITHTYRTPGMYTATVTVTDPGGETDTASVQITVAGPPLASTPDEGSAGGVAGESGTRWSVRVKAPRSERVRRVYRRGLRLKVRCAQRCSARTILKLSGRRIGRSERVRIRSGRKRTIKVRLDRRVRRDLMATMREAGVRGLKVTAATRVRTGDGTRTIRRRVRLRLG